MKFIPHKYQEYASEFICEHPESMLVLDMGLGRQNGDFTDGCPETDV
jgi:hypothetical protein